MRAGGLSPWLLYGQRPCVDGGVPLWCFLQVDRQLTGRSRWAEVGFLGVVSALVPLGPDGLHDLVPPLFSLGPDTTQKFPQCLSMGRLGLLHCKSTNKRGFSSETCSQMMQKYNLDPGTFNSVNYSVPTRARRSQLKIRTFSQPKACSSRLTSECIMLFFVGDPQES